MAGIKSCVTPNVCRGSLAEMDLRFLIMMLLGLKTYGALSKSWEVVIDIDNFHMTVTVG